MSLISYARTLFFTFKFWTREVKSTAMRKIKLFMWFYHKKILTIMLCMCQQLRCFSMVSKRVTDLVLGSELLNFNHFQIIFIASFKSNLINDYC